MKIALSSAPVKNKESPHNIAAMIAAISFGFIERDGDALYSSCAFIGADGEIIHRFRRVSIGWKDYRADEWNSAIKHEYAEQAEKCGKRVLLINPYCADENAADAAAGGAVDFRNGKIQAELPAGNSGMLMINV